MFSTNFKIQKTEFSFTIDPTVSAFTVASIPRPYDVKFVDSDGFAWLADTINSTKGALLLIDSNVRNQLMAHLSFTAPTYLVEAVEENKSINTVLKICDWLLEQRANRGSHLYVVGGGIVQDLGAFSGYMYKRGIPWTLVPTTLLSQADSGLGGKTAVNYGSSKNVLGLFSAPRQVLVDAEFTRTLTDFDFLSGGGEILRLLTTGGASSFEFLEQTVDQFVARDAEAIQQLTASSLFVKQSIVEADEFEIDLRRSMNYGHSIGHAIEALSNYKIPHGQGVALGIFVENMISVNRNLLDSTVADRIFRTGRKLISDSVWQEFINLDVSKLLPYLSNDKKAQGTTLPIATLVSLGNMQFLGLELNADGLFEIEQAVNKVKQIENIVS
jgi:3-dehydroquinate synthase